MTVTAEDQYVVEARRQLKKQGCCFCPHCFYPDGCKQCLTVCECPNCVCWRLR